MSPLPDIGPKSAEALRRRMLEMAATPQGLTWRRVHDTVNRDDRVRAASVFKALTSRTGPLHPRTNGRQTWWFASYAQAAAWTLPPVFNRSINAAAAAKPLAPKKTRAGEVKVTVCPAPRWDSRYQIDPETRVLGGFATLGMGRYLDEHDSSNP